MTPFHSKFFSEYKLNEIITFKMHLLGSQEGGGGRIEIERDIGEGGG